MTKLLLVRHGRPSLPEEKVFYGSTDLPLSDEGSEQAKALVPLWERIKPQKIFSSPLSRAVETARLSGLEPKLVEGLKEIDMGSWEMVPFRTISQDHPQAFQDRWRDIETFRPPGGENFQDVAKRATEAIRNLISNQEDQEGSIVVFGHMGLFRTILWKELDIPLKNTFTIDQDHCGIHVLNFQPKKTTLKRANWLPLEEWGKYRL